MINGTKKYTLKDYRKRPSWRKVFEFISRSLLSVTKDDIIKSFYLAEINKNCSCPNADIVNNKLSMILNQGQLKVPSDISSDTFTN